MWRTISTNCNRRLSADQIKQMAQQLKQLYQAHQYQQCADLANVMLKKTPKDKAALLFLAQSQVHLNELTECQSNLNTIYTITKPGPDDALIISAFLCQDQLSIELQKSKETRKYGRDIQIKNKFQIIDFFDRKKNIEKMIQESEVYCLLLLEDSQFKVVEDTYLWLFNHTGLTNQQRASYGARIFEIDQFYNPYTRLDTMFNKLCLLAPSSPDLHQMAWKILDQLDKQQGRKSVYTAINDTQQNAVPQYLEFCNKLMFAAQKAFVTPDHIFKNNQSVKMFTRYLGAVASTTLFGTPEWTNFVSKVDQLLQTQYCAKTIGDFDQNPIQLFLFAITDFTKFQQEIRIPAFSELHVSKLDVTKLKEILDTFSKEFSEYSQLVNAYILLIATSTDCPIALDPQSVYAKANQSSFIARKVGVAKICQQSQVSMDFKVLIQCLQLKLKIGPETINETIELTKQLLNRCSEPVLNLFNTITADLIWRTNLNQGQWLEAIEALTSLKQLQPSRHDFAVVKQCQIKVQHLKDICQADEVDQFLNGIMQTLQSECSQVEADNLTLQGYLIWSYPALFDCDPKTVLSKWLAALKKDQASYEIYYSLAVYYYKVNDVKRASGCLDKVLKLKPDLERALVLQYHLLQSIEQRLALIDKFMESNVNSAASYFLRGLIMQSKRDFVQAIEMFQNALKFQAIQNSNPVLPLLLPAIDLPIQNNPFGIYGNAALCWVYLSECFIKIDKPQVALKCFSKGLLEMSKVQINNDYASTDETKYILGVTQFEGFKPVEEVQQDPALPVVEDPIIKVIETLQPSKYALECLLLGSQFVESPEASIMILNVALQCAPSPKMLAFILTGLISRITQIIQTVVIENGKLLPPDEQIINRLDQLVQIASQPQYLDCQNLQKKRLNAIFIMAQRTQQPSRFRESVETAKQLFEQNESLLLDYTKTIHEYQRYSSDIQLQQTKELLIKKAIRLNPGSAGLWVHQHLYSTDGQVKAQSIYKAYELDPENTFVQEAILRHYFATQQWKKAFKIIIRSYQTATNANEPQQPIILAALAYMNAFCYFKTGNELLLSEALSLVRLVQREDMQQVLYEVYVYLNLYKGDFETVIPYLEAQPKTSTIDMLLYKAYFGTQTKTYSELTQAEFTYEALNKVINIEQLSDAQLLNETNLLIEKYTPGDLTTSSMLCLLQELCLKRNLLPAKNLLDMKVIFGQLKHILLAQCLRLVLLRDGKVNEVQEKDDSVGYTQWIVELGKCKQNGLTSNQHKALLRCYLNAKHDPESLQGLFLDSSAIVSQIDKQQGLRQVLKSRVSTQPRLPQIKTLLERLSGSNNPGETKVVASQIINTIASVTQPNHLLLILFNTLQVCLLQQGHYLAFIKLAKDLLSFASVKLSPYLVNVIWNYQLLNTGSALMQLKKITQVMPILKELGDVCKMGLVIRHTLPVNLLKARTQLALNNIQAAMQALNIDDPVIERDFLAAIALFVSQDYSQYYLACLGLVAGAKQANIQSFTLAYAYYLKALAEMTFLVAKRTNIKLKDDFTLQEAAKYDLEFFQVKATTSIDKCMKHLEGDEDGLLWKAVMEMKQQLL